MDGLELYVGEELFDTARLLVSELVTNSVRHAGLGPRDLIEIDVTAHDDLVRVEVTDMGAGFEPPLSPESDSRSGWGLLLTDRLARRWGVSSAGRTSVWFEVAQGKDAHRHRASRH